MEATELHKQNTFWLLVEVENDNGTNLYNVINTSDIVRFHGQDNLDRFSTGNLIYIRNNQNKIVQATIVTISDDKNYVDTELRHLRQMSNENLNLNQSKHFNEIKQEHSKKRKRGSEATNGQHNKKITSNSSSQSSSSGTEEYQRPMMFDQYCQTDFKSTGDSIGQSQQFDKLFALQNTILEEQKRTGNESKGVHEFVVSLMEQVEQLKQIVTDMNSKIDTINDKSAQGVILYDAKNSRRSLASLNNSTSNLTIETYEVTHDVTDNSQLNESHFSNSSAKTVDFQTSFKNLNRTNSTHSLNSSVSQNNSNNLVIDQIKNDWGEDDEENVSENAKIGTFKTEVPKHILRSINWKSHTGATRKLLMALFTRKVLATHSLTGKPSPGNFLLFFF